MTGRRTKMLALIIATVLGPVACSSGGTGDAPPSAGAATIAATAASTQIYLSPDGDDENPGTQAAPLQSVNRAVKLARPGTNVIFEDGTYKGSVTTDISGTADARIMFTSATKGGAKIVGDGSQDAAWQNDGNYVDIVGFDITGSNEDGLVSGGSFVRILNNNVHEFHQGNCITTANENYDLHDVDIMGNVASRCGASELDHGIYVGQPRGVVANNIVYDNTGYGIHCWHNCNALDISNNLVFGNEQGGIVIGQGDDPNNGDVNADNFVVANNIAIDNGRDGIRESGATGPNNQFVNNILWNNGTKRINLQTGTENGTLVTDPLFVNFQKDGSGNYHLLPNSPAIGAGVELGAPAIDFDGKPRPANAGVDIGVYQH
jgi:hypothetical protein